MIDPEALLALHEDLRHELEPTKEVHGEQAEDESGRASGVAPGVEEDPPALDA